MSKRECACWKSITALASVGVGFAIESESIVLMHSDLMGVPWAIDLSKKIIRDIKQNLF